MGLQDFGAGGRTGAADVGGVSGAAADGSNVGFSLRDALEPAGQPLEGSAFYGGDEVGEAEAGCGVCVGAGGRGLHGQCAVGGFAKTGCAVHVRARRRAARARAWRAAAADRATSVRVEEGEVGARVHGAGSRSPRVLGAQWLSRVRRPVEGATVLWKLSR